MECTTNKKLLTLMFVIQGALLLGYFRYSISGGQLNIVPTGDTRSKIDVASALSLSRDPDFQNLINLNDMEDLSIRFPDTHTDSPSQERSHRISVAVGMGLTTRSKSPTKDLSQHIFFTSLIPSFCKTASEGYSYTFYVAFDYNDPMLSKADEIELFNKTFSRVRNGACKHLTYLGLNMVKCSHMKKPAWAQNDAMMSAYMDDSDFYYRINDDTTMVTGNWTSQFIKTLSEYDPPNVGVVGPTHSGGNTAILTYDFVHRSHVDAFGLYYPRDFIDWHGDRWITDVYRPGRITKLKDIKLKHTMSKGTRYKVHSFHKDKVKGIIDREKKVLSRYIEAKEKNLGHDKGRIIAMALVGDSAKDTYGAVRNIMLQPIHFPTWTLRVYLEQPSQNSTEKYKYPPVPDNVVTKLKHQPVQLVFVNTKNISFEPSLWPVLAVDDPTVDYLLVRKPTSRLSDRDAAVVSDWLDSGKAVHVIKDHPAHSSSEIVPGLWGADAKKLRDVLPGRIGGILGKSKNETQFLKEVLWPLVANHTLCHDSVGCSNGSKPFPVPRVDHEYLGREFGACGEFIVEKIDDNPKCATS